ncbi:hypothetical protein GCG54_00015168 [Colletotrichum gloeosporioides]|uniref:DUF7025 domain-containing protein n=1 Tax=Colletotrichum gloeosporioides TaxID=474922 RepID=A0A8H4CDU8_COLGL|nr:uncharacterized protein GCG54_00015168 [Colletotrichum gloeosporioides]KAF3801946.1 hypothetical protein GCG54_00015168 [Colletotrichum gloeosporioides]
MNSSEVRSLVEKLRVLETRILELERRPHTSSDAPTSPLHHQAGDNNLQAAPQSSHILDSLKPPEDGDGNQSHHLADGEDDAALMVDYGSRRDRLRKTFDWEMERLFLHEEAEMRRRDRARRALLHSTHAHSAQNASIAYRENQAPALRTEEWSSFKQLNRPRDTSLCAIDILIGEPVVYDKMGLSGNWIISSERLARSRTASGEVDGQFPERIRIHSDLLVTILDKIIKSSGSDRMASDSRPVVFTRPFKALTYCELVHGIATRYLQSLGFSKAPVADLHRESSRITELAEANLSDDDSSTDHSIPESNEKSRARDIDTIRRFPKAFEEIDFFRQVLKSKVLRRRECLQQDTCQKVFFSDLWHLFRPGMEIIHSGTNQAFRVLHVTSARHRMLSNLQRWAGHPYRTAEDKEQRPDFRVTCIHIDFDGSKIGPVIQKFDFDAFQGERDVRSLPVFPLRLYSLPNANSIDKKSDSRQAEAAWFRKMLIRRGMRFLESIALQHMRYAGPVIGTDEEIEGEVMVDFEAAFTADIGSNSQVDRPRIANLSGLLMLDDFAMEDACQFACCEKDYVHDDTNIDKIQTADYLQSLQPEIGSERPPSIILRPRTLSDIKESANSTQSLFSDDELLLLSNRVFAFVLRSQRWAELKVEFLRDVQGRGSTSKAPGSDPGSSPGELGAPPPAESDSVSALDRLVLPQYHKRLIISLLTEHFRTVDARRDPNAHYDVIKGKGELPEVESLFEEVQLN